MIHIFILCHQDMIVGSVRRGGPQGTSGCLEGEPASHSPCSSSQRVAFVAEKIQTFKFFVVRGWSGLMRSFLSLMTLTTRDVGLEWGKRYSEPLSGTQYSTVFSHVAGMVAGVCHIVKAGNNMASLIDKAILP